MDRVGLIGLGINPYRILYVLRRFTVLRADGNARYRFPAGFPPAAAGRGEQDLSAPRPGLMRLSAC